MSQTPETMNFKGLHLRAFVSEAKSLEALRQFAKQHDWPQEAIQEGNAEKAAEYLASNPTPDYLIIEVPSADAAPGMLDKVADVCDPHVKVIVTSLVDEFSFFCWLTEIGIQHYMLQPINEEKIIKALSQPSGGDKNAQKTAKEGQLIVVMGARGGVGATTIASNLGFTISELTRTPTGVIDLEPQWGAVSMLFDLEPSRGMREALEKPDRIDGLFMERVMIKPSENLALLSSEEPFDTPVLVHEDAATALIRETKAKFKHVVANLPREFTPLTQTFLKEADHVLIVTELSLLSLRDAMRIKDFLTDKLKVKKLSFVANRVGMVAKYDMVAADFEKNLGGKIAYTVPFDMEAYGKTATGELLAEIKNSNAAKALRDMAVEMAGSKKAGVSTGGKTGETLLTKILGKKG